MNTEQIFPIISIVSPVYKAEACLRDLVEEIHNSMLQIGKSYEIILVDDRSPDRSWEIMRQISQKYKEVKCVRLSRNFGQHPAIMAGLSQAKGNWIVVMDCDLQDQPKEIIKLYQKALEGYDIVLAKRKNRKDSFLKKMSSIIFSKVYGFFTDTKFDNEVANFGIYHQKVISEVLKMNDFIKSFPLFINWVGYKKTSIIVEHAQREGKSSYTISKLISLAFNTIISFSNKPLKMCVKFGLIISMGSFFIGIWTIVKYLKGEISVLGYSSLIISIWFLSGVIITLIGVLGVYLGKMFDQTKNRASYIIDQII